MRFRGVYLVAKKEFMDKVRNRWILVLSFLFVAICMTLAYLGGAQGGLGLGFQDFATTVPALTTVMATLVPLVSLILGYATIAGEDESGSLHLLLSLAVTRTEVLLGKFLGLGAVIVTTVLVGLGVTGVAIAAAAGTDGAAGYLGFMAVAMLVGLLFLSLSMCLSSFARRRATALGGAVFLYFFFFAIFDLVVFGILLATGWKFDLSDPSTIETIPEWIWALILLDPVETGNLASYMIVGSTQAFGFPLAAPAFITMPLLLGVMLTWMVVPLGLSFFAFRRRDL